jgi:hypothetical protein
MEMEACQESGCCTGQINATNGEMLFRDFTIGCFKTAADFLAVRLDAGLITAG